MNLTNISYLNSLLLANLRTTYYSDALVLNLIVPMAMIGTILNAITILILTRKTFRNINIFKIMLVYSITGSIITFGGIFFFLFTPYILFELSISLMGRIYTCYLLNSIFLLFFFYGNCLDILMNLERALSFSNGYQKIKQTSPYLICFIALIICIIIHIPSNLAQAHTPDDELYVKFRLCYSTTFITNPISKMILIASYIIEGPIVMILVIGSNILAYISYKSFMKRKQESTNVNRSAELTEREKRKQAKTEKMNQKLLMMAIYLTVFSIIIHIIQFGAQLIIFVLNSTISPLLYGWARFTYTLIILFKHFITIFFYYYFNLNFKRTLLSFICKQRLENSLNTVTRSNNILNR